MTAPRTPLAYLGDPLNAAALRLAGVLTYAPADPACALRDFNQAQGRADIVLLALPVAAMLPAAVLASALTGTAPLVSLVPHSGAPGEVSPLDPAERARRQLGLDV